MCLPVLGAVKADSLIDGGAWIYEPIPGRRVLIVTYGCTVLNPEQRPLLSHEHKQIGLSPPTRCAV